ncbi:MAG: DUF669 domain-containing protein [Alicyclobacillus sp.]|nr:DUF669 domain-containing protein [Alicyclobacillus sp.]
MTWTWEELDELYEQTAPASAWTDPLPDGEYICTLARAELRQNQGNDGMHVWLQFRVAEGEYKGRHIIHRRVLSKDPTSISWLKRDLVAIGYGGKLSELGGRLPACVGRTVRVTLKTNRRDRRQYTILSASGGQ